MERYIWKIICKSLKTYGLYDCIKHIYIIETTETGKKAYEKLGFNYKTEGK